MKIKSGGKDLFQSGRVLAFGMNKIEITISEEDDPLTFNFGIVNDANREEAKTDVTPINNKMVNIDFINFPLGVSAGNSEPFKLGIINNRRLYLSYEVQVKPDLSTWLFSFTFYLGQGIDE